MAGVNVSTCICQQKRPTQRDLHVQKWIYIYTTRTRYTNRNLINQSVYTYVNTRSPYEILTAGKRPDTCEKRPITCQERSITCQKRPDACHERPDICQKRPNTCQKRPITCQKRPASALMNSRSLCVYSSLFLDTQTETWSLLTYTATVRHCCALQHTAAHCSTLQHTATHCYALLRTATYCNIPQHTAAHGNTLEAARVWYTRQLQHTATRCNTLLHTTTHCNTLGGRHGSVTKNNGNTLCRSLFVYLSLFVVSFDRSLLTYNRSLLTYIRSLVMCIRSLFVYLSLFVHT